MTQLLSPLTSTPYPSPTSNAITDLLEVPDAVLWLEKYVNMRFASTAARDAAIPSPEDGMQAYIVSTPRSLYYYDSSAAAWKIQWIAPQNYTPAWTSTGTAPALGNGTITGRWMQTLQFVEFEINLVPGSTTTFGTGNYSFSLPTTSATSGFTSLGQAQLLIGGSRWPGQILISPSVATCQPFLATSTTDPRLTQMTGTAPGTFATGNTLRIQGRYETA